MSQPTPPKVDIDTLRNAVRKEYAEVAANPTKGFHFHTGRPLAKILGYPDKWIDAVPESALACLAGTGNPFSLGEIQPEEHVVDVGSGGGFDSFIAARLVGKTGAVIGVDMTPEMLHKARTAAAEAGVDNVEFRAGHAEALPVPDGWADVVISNGVVNLCPDKVGVFREMYRVLKPGGRLQIGDILVETPVPEAAKENIDLWTG
jgi:arsenite methyltransferase